jgi:uncharacterized repeat protein (TIGR01451 family)
MVRLQVRVPASTENGKDLEYRLHVKNSSTAAAHHVRVRVHHPQKAHARFVKATPEPTTQTPDLVWELGTLEANASRDIILVLQPDGSGDVTVCARVQFEHGQCVTTQIARPSLAVKETGPSQASLNDALTYRIEVRNTGSATANAVVLRDTLPDGLTVLDPQGAAKNPLTWDIGTLAAGQSVIREYQARAVKTGMLCTTVEATAAGGLRSEAQSCVTVGEAKLHLEMKGPDKGWVGKPATFQLTISNPGTAAAGNVMLAGPLPARTTFVSASDGGRLVGNQVQWSLDRLGPSERRTVQLVLTATEAGEVAVSAAASADRIDKATAEAHTPFEGVTGLTAVIAARDNPVEVGMPTSYLITVRNQGDAPATQVGVAALVPEQMKVVEARGQTTYRVEGQRVVFEALTSLAPRMEAQYEVRVMPQTAGDVRFQVELTAAQLSAEAGPVRRQESTTISARDGTPRLQPVPNLQLPAATTQP